MILEDEVTNDKFIFMASNVINCRETDLYIKSYPTTLQPMTKDDLNVKSLKEEIFINLYNTFYVDLRNIIFTFYIHNVGS